jgi:hypothetical protein
VGIKRIIDDHSATKTIAVLRDLGGRKRLAGKSSDFKRPTMMRVIPERPCLARSAELVQERVSRRDGALGNTSGAIGPGASSLEETVPMLQWYGVISLQSNSRSNSTHDTGATKHGGVREGVLDVQPEYSSLARESKSCQCSLRLSM